MSQVTISSTQAATSVAPSNSVATMRAFRAAAAHTTARKATAPDDMLRPPHLRAGAPNHKCVCVGCWPGGGAHGAGCGCKPGTGPGDGGCWPGGGAHGAGCGARQDDVMFLIGGFARSQSWWPASWSQRLLPEQCKNIPANDIAKASSTHEERLHPPTRRCACCLALNLAPTGVGPVAAPRGPLRCLSALVPPLSSLLLGSCGRGCGNLVSPWLSSQIVCITAGSKSSISESTCGRNMSG